MFKQRIVYACLIFLISISITFKSHASIVESITKDYHYYYSGMRFNSFSAWVATGAVIANSGIDKNFQRYWQHKMRNHHQDEIFRVFQKFGENAFSHLPLFLMALSLGDSANEGTFLSSIGKWGDIGIRLWALSGPQQLLLTNFFGGERPGPGSKSHWQPFHGYRGVSGHAFFGAVPWLAASEATDDPVFKKIFFTLSILPSLARVNNNFHFISQAWLGWGFAYLGARAIARSEVTQSTEYDWVIMPIALEDGMMFGVRVYF